MFCAKSGKEITKNTESTQKKVILSKNTKILLLAGVAVIAVLAVILLALGGGPGYDSPEELVNNYIKSFYAVDFEGQLDCVGDWTIRDAIQEIGLPPVSRSEFLEACEAHLGDEMLLKYEPKEVEILNVYVKKYLYGDDIDWDDYDLTTEEVESIRCGAKVEVICKVNGEEVERHFECIESNGKWFIWD